MNNYKILLTDEDEDRILLKSKNGTTSFRIGYSDCSCGIKALDGIENIYKHLKKLNKADTSNFAHIILNSLKLYGCTPAFLYMSYAYRDETISLEFIDILNELSEAEIEYEVNPNSGNMIGFTVVNVEKLKEKYG